MLLLCCCEHRVQSAFCEPALYQLGCHTPHVAVTDDARVGLSLCVPFCRLCIWLSSHVLTISDVKNGQQLLRGWCARVLAQHFTFSSFHEPAEKGVAAVPSPALCLSIHKCHKPPTSHPYAHNTALWPHSSKQLWLSLSE